MQGPVLEVEEAEGDTLTVLVVGVHEMIEGMCLLLDSRFRSESLTDVSTALCMYQTMTKLGWVFFQVAVRKS